MLRYALVYGLISGVIIIASVLGGIMLANSETNFSVMEWLGYLVMLVALSLIFVGVQRYRNEVRGGIISFWEALGVGVAISLVASVIYVAVWEAYLFQSDYAFINVYADGLIEEKRAAGASPEALAAFTDEMERMKAQYGEAGYRLGITFIEIFPMGLLISLISAVFLRRRAPADEAAAAPA